LNKGYIALPWLLFGSVLVVFLIYISIQSKDDETIVVSSDGEEINKQTLYETMLDYNGEEVINLLIFERLIELEANRKNLNVTDKEINEELVRMKGTTTSDEEFEMMLAQNGMSEEDLLEQMETQLTLRKLFEENVQITKEDLKNYYDENKELYIEEENIRASHILVDSKKEAENILELLKQGKEFAELAQMHSTDGSKDQGGDLGFFERGMMTPPFEEAAFALDVGELSGVVESEHGFHIIKLTDKKEETIHSFEDIKDDIRNQLFDMEISNQLPEWVEQQKAEYGFEIKANL
jgi:foldase protein PrsA